MINVTLVTLPQNYLFITDQTQKEIVTIRTDQPDFSKNFSVRGEVPGAIVMFDRDQQPGYAGKPICCRCEVGSDR